MGPGPSSGVSPRPVSRTSPSLTPTLASGMNSVIFSFVHFQVFRGHFGGLRQSPMPYGKPPKELHVIRFLLAQSNPTSCMRAHIFGCSRMHLPLQPNGQGSDYVMDSPSSLLFSTGGGSWGHLLKRYMLWYMSLISFLDIQ